MSDLIEKIETRLYIIEEQTEKIRELLKEFDTFKLVMEELIKIRQLLPKIKD